jgi:hypothetical protein
MTDASERESAAINGRNQIDLLIQEQVFGWKRRGFEEDEGREWVSPEHYDGLHGADWQHKGRHPRLAHPTDFRRIIYVCDCQFQRGENLPFYSTHIATTWIVVAEMETQGYHFTVSGRHTIGPYHASFWLPGEVSGQANEETLPLAICRAALTATSR